MESVNVTVRMNKEVKRDFEDFCDNVGINITTAFNMFVKATLRTRELPFRVTDTFIDKAAAQKRFGETVKAMQEQSIANGTSDMTLDEINAIIADVKKSAVKQNA